MEEQFLSTAISIGNSICRDAIHYNSHCNWIGVSNDLEGKNSKSYYAALNGTWYNGTSGIAWFLAQLHSISSDKRHRIVAIGAINQALQMTKSVQYGKLGFHSGLTGISFSAIEIGEKLGQEDLIVSGLSLLKDINQLSEAEYTLDVIDGCAGAIPAIIRLNRKYNEDTLEELLNKMGKYLLQQAQLERIGISWNTIPHGSTANLTGYAHGAAGIAGALLELYQYTKDEQYQKAAFRGFAYEESCFDSEQNNWPDFRTGDAPRQDESKPYPCGCAWCHGAPGIGLSRLRAYQLTKLEEFKKSGQIALDTTMRFFDQKQLGNYSLCHGVFGNADLLHYAAEVIADKTLTDKVKETAAEAAEKFERRKIPFPNGTQSDFNSPDFMLGMAGIGYGFLRLTNIGAFESALLIH